MKTDEFKTIAAAALFIALPSIVLSMIAVLVLGRESESIERRLDASHAGAMGSAVRSTAAELTDAAQEARSAASALAERSVGTAGVHAGLSALCGRDRAFSLVFTVTDDGTVRAPATGPELGPAADEWPPDAPEDCRRLLAVAQAQEFADRSPQRAERTWRALADQCSRRDDPGTAELMAYAVFAQARCAVNSGDFARGARLFSDFASSYPWARGEEGMPLAPAALSKAAASFDSAADRAAAGRALAELAAFVGRNRDALDPGHAAIFTDIIAKSGDRDALRRLETAAEYADQVSDLRLSFSDQTGAGDRAGTGFGRGFLTSADGRRIAYSCPAGSDLDGAALTAVFLVDREFFERSFRRRAADSSLGEDIRLTLAWADGRPVTGADAIPEGWMKVSSRPFPPPLESWQALLSAQKPSGVRALSFLRWSLLFWVTVLSAATIAAGTVIGVRWVNRQIRLAREKTDFVSSVTHELKTPLTSIRMFTETLLMDRVSSDSERRECVQVIADETDRLSRLINRMLDFSKMERGLRMFSFREEDPGSILRAAIQAFDAQGRAGPQIEVQALGPFPPLVCDRDAVVEVLINLLGNAVKYSRNSEKVVVRAWSSRGKSHFSVMDRGVGIPRNEHRKIFEKFYRVDDSLAKEVDGCGLGLSIAAHIARAHGGSITIESEPGRGSIFTLRLPEKGPAAKS